MLYLGRRPTGAASADALHRVVSGAGGQCDRIVANDWTQLLSEQWVTRQLRRISRPFAVMGCNDGVAACAVRAANAAGWRVPAEVGVIGVDDKITECIGVQPPLSSISIERFRIGREAARLLDELLMGKVAARQLHRFRPQHVIERESTSTFVYGDPDIAAAVAFIYREACNGIRIDDVVRNSNLLSPDAGAALRRDRRSLPGGGNSPRPHRRRQTRDRVHAPAAGGHRGAMWFFVPFFAEPQLPIDDGDGSSSVSEESADGRNGTAHRLAGNDKHFVVTRQSNHLRDG